METLPCYEGIFVNPTCRMFHRVFWTFPPCVEGFKYCKRFVSVDGTHLYGKYGGTLLMAIAQDGNSNILPIAFAVVEGETTDAWSFFLTNLRRHVTPQQGVLIISDRHAAIKAALDAEGSGWHPPQAYHAYCIRHIASNFALKFKDKEAKRALINAAYSKTQAEFDHYYGLVVSFKPEYDAWVKRIPLAKWTQLHDEGRRYGHMTTNLSECINAVLKGVRNLPITAIVKATYYRLAALFVKKGQQAEAQLASGARFSQALLRAIEINRQSTGSMFVTNFSRSNESFVVQETQHMGSSGVGTYRVRLMERWCDCGHFQAFHYPCKHVLAACGYPEVHLDWTSFVDDVYSMRSVFNVYRMEFQPASNETLWPQLNGPRLVPNPELRRAKEGRPVSSRIRNEMDDVETTHGKRCGLCRQSGHSRRRCPHSVVLPP